MIQRMLRFLRTSSSLSREESHSIGGFGVNRAQKSRVSRCGTFGVRNAGQGFGGKNFPVRFKIGQRFQQRKMDRMAAAETHELRPRSSNRKGRDHPRHREACDGRTHPESARRPGSGPRFRKRPERFRVMLLGRDDAFSVYRDRR